MIEVRKANEYSSCLSCGSDKDVHAVIMKNLHSCNTLEVTLCSSCLLALVEKMQLDELLSKSEGNHEESCQT